MRQRLIGQRLARLDGGPPGGRLVARSKRDHAARKGVETELLAALAQHIADGCGAVPDVAQDRPNEQGDGPERHQNYNGAKDARLDLIALPLNGELARAVGDTRPVS